MVKTYIICIYIHRSNWILFIYRHILKFKEKKAEITCKGISYCFFSFWFTCYSKSTKSTWTFWKHNADKRCIKSVLRQFNSFFGTNQLSPTYSNCFVKFRPLGLNCESVKIVAQLFFGQIFLFDILLAKVWKVVDCSAGISLTLGISSFNKLNGST